MSASPSPKDAPADADTVAAPADPTPEKSESLERMDRGDADGGAGAYNEFDVKEQDRWLPIANGEPIPFLRALTLLLHPPGRARH